MATDTEVVSVAELAAMFTEDIPCGKCDKPALLRSDGHGSGQCRKPYYKCLACWQAWVQRITGHLHNSGSFYCVHCGEIFFDVKSFSDYREF